VSANLFYYVEA